MTVTKLIVMKFLLAPNLFLKYSCAKFHASSKCFSHWH